MPQVCRSDCSADKNEFAPHLHTLKCTLDELRPMSQNQGKLLSGEICARGNIDVRRGLAQPRASLGRDVTTFLSKHERKGSEDRPPGVFVARD